MSGGWSVIITLQYYTPFPLYPTSLIGCLSSISSSLKPPDKGQGYLVGGKLRGKNIYKINSLKSGAFEFDGTENGGIELKSGAFESDVASNSKVATFESSVNSKVALLSLT